MRLHTLIKFGSLAFSVAQDDKVRELLKIAHRGIKRRGLVAPVPPAQAPMAQPYSMHRVPANRWPGW